MRISDFWKDKQGTVVVWQRPNAPLTVWLVCMVASHFLSAGKPKDIISLVGLIALVIWAVLEIAQGASYFRRALGVVVLLAMIVSRI